jgi:N-hydroxyarylamine O-acetyltransferase
MVGLVDLDRRWVVDVGLADGPLEPFPLEEREWREGELQFRLERLDGEWWRFHNHEHGLANTFDFTERPRELSWYQGMCTRLQIEDFSPFVQYAIASRRSQVGYQALRDTSHFHVKHGKLTERIVDTREDYAELLAGILDHDLGDEASTLWEGAVRRAAARKAVTE